MKKILALVLALVMVLSLVACGGSSAPAATEAPKADAPAEAPAAKEEPKADPMKIDIASLYTDGTVCDDACIKLAELLNESGLFKVEYYNNSQRFAQGDIGGAAMNMCHEAMDLGLSTCMLGMTDQAKLQ